MIEKVFTSEDGPDEIVQYRWLGGVSEVRSKREEERWTGWTAWKSMSAREWRQFVEKAKKERGFVDVINPRRS